MHIGSSVHVGVMEVIKKLLIQNLSIYQNQTYPITTTTTHCNKTIKIPEISTRNKDSRNINKIKKS